MVRERPQPAGSTIGEGVDVPDNYRKDPEAISRLAPEQYRVTQQNGYGAYRKLFEPAHDTRSAS
jgi:hypothetical protein